MTESFPARGFGPGLPPEGAPVTVRPAGAGLAIQGWPGIDSVRRADLRGRRQGGGVLLEWRAPPGPCALMVDGRLARSLLGGDPPLVRPRRDGATTGWLWGALFLAIGLPLLLLAGFFVFRAEIVDAAVARIPVERERQLAEELWKFHRQGLRLVEGTAANRFLEEAGARLLAVGKTPYDYRFHLADEPSVNAFALPGGHVVVHRGLLAKAATAEEVAGVLAHEIEHVEQRHSLRGLVQEAGLTALWIIVTGDAGSGTLGGWLKDLAGLQFSRQQETAADLGGYRRLLAAAIDPRGMASFFDRLARDQEALPAALAILSTHPASAERSASLQALLQAAPVFPPMAVDWPAVQAAASRP